MENSYNEVTKHIKNYKLSSIGIGDIILFSSQILQEGIGEEINIEINRDIIEIYKNNNENYLKFCESFLQKILYKTKINFFPKGGITNSDFILNWDIINISLSNIEILNHFKKIFKNNKIINEKYIVLITKIRDYPFHEFEKIENIFFENLNKLNFKIVLIGEREVVYGREYSILEDQTVYSIYQKIMNNINKDLIIDLSIENFNPDSPNLESFMKDASIIFNSYKTILIGRGGFFCASLFYDELVSLGVKWHYDLFDSQINNKLFFEFDKFLNKINNV